MKKTIVLIRHAHRDNALRVRDNGLSDKGLEQARWLKKYFCKRFEKPSAVWLVSSPKKRCIETLEPIAAEGGWKIDAHPDLHGQALGESQPKFEARPPRFLNEWKASPQELTVVCSHGDWLPDAVQYLLGASVDFKKGAWLELDWEGAALLKGFIPSFKPFYDT